MKGLRDTALERNCQVMPERCMKISRYDRIEFHLMTELSSVSH